MQLTQISKIVAAKSVDGLAPFSIYSDLVIYIINAVYHIVSGSPFRFVGGRHTVEHCCVAMGSLRMVKAVVQLALYTAGAACPRATTRSETLGPRRVGWKQ